MPASLARSALLALALLAAPAGSQADTLVLLTGEWPPYTGVKEPQGGSMAAIVKAAYANLGDEVKLGFFSWYRVARLQEDDSRFTASFPHYHSAERAARCHFSRPIGSSPLGLAVRAASRPRWNTVEDLGRYRIGTVKSYVNVGEFDRLVAAGKVRTLLAVDDEDNLRNLVAGKVDAIIIDRNVFAYLQRSDGFRRSAAQLALDPRVLAVHNLYMCFPRNEKGRRARDHFDAGLARLQEPPAD